ncbi:hypothetical protein [Actinoplanes sp. TFC3]|uniref:hypothetical protein n=1 Tax=Actinoplanes sp. TFC3 TaxID=1710355 RepID=UPI000835A39C|nr:hypothetical protein [Actinoplanes sp. TFC3]
MSYEQLAQHAAKIEQSAAIMDLKQRGFTYHNGRFSDAGMTSEAVQDAVDGAAARFAGVADMFTPFLGMPDPNAFDPLSQALGRVATTLNSRQGEVPYNEKGVLANPALGGIDDVKGLVKDWYGGAAQNFKDNFLSKWDAITSNQLALVIALKGGIEAEAAMWREARANVDELAHKAQASLDAMLDCNPKDVALMLTVAGSIFAVGAAVASGGTALGLTIVGEAASSSAAIPMKDPEPVQFGGKNASEVVNGIQKALNKLAQQIMDAENVVRDAMVNCQDVMSRNMDRILAPRPLLADATAATIRDNYVGLGTAEG